MLTADNHASDYNIALAQTLDKEYSRAEETINQIEESGDVIYLKAIIAIRNDDDETALKMLKKAIAKDCDYKEKARNDMEFISLQTNEKFIVLLE